jgi:hypothetical protein
MTTTTLRKAVVLAAALAALGAGAGAPAAGAAGLDPSIYDPGVAPGQIEHGVMSSVLTGSPEAWDRRVEYWVSADRWREQTTDAKTGELLNARIHDASGTTWLQYKPIRGRPRVEHFKGQDSVPGPGMPAPYSRKVLAGGVVGGSDEHPIAVTLQPIGPRRVAGLPGTAYEQLSNGQPGFEHAPGSHARVVLQDGTAQPLLREWTVPNGTYGGLVQREVLLSRETLSSQETDVLTRKALARTVTRWKAKVKALKAAKGHHKK